MNTSSFQLFMKDMDQPSLQVLQGKEAEMDRKSDPQHKLGPALSDLWKGVRTSMSGESFISSSTKVSESQDKVGMEGGWTDDEDGDLEEFYLSDDDDESVAGSVAGEDLELTTDKELNGDYRSGILNK